MRTFLVFLGFFHFTGISQEHIGELIAEVDTVASEVSGIVSTADDRIFVIGDSGSAAEVYEINKSGEILNTISILNAQNIDWEELQLDNDGNLYIGDIGNNLSQRTDLVIYKIPHFSDSLHLTSMDYAELISFTYEDQLVVESNPNGEFDAEAFIVLNEEIHLFSKDHSVENLTKIYTFPASIGIHNALLTSQIPNTKWLTGVHYNADCDKIYFTSINGVRSFNNYSEVELAEETCSAILPMFENRQIESLTQLNTGEFLVAEDIEDGSSSILFSLFTSCSSKIDFKLGPVPSHDYLTIRSEHIFQTIRIYDKNGQLVLSENYTEAIKQETLDISSFTSGIFILEVSSSEATLIKRFMKL